MEILDWFKKKKTKQQPRSVKGTTRIIKLLAYLLSVKGTCFRHLRSGTSLAVQWLRLDLAGQGV